MKGLSTKVSKSLIPSTRLTCADNSGAYEIMIINKLGKAGKKGRLAKSGIGDLVICSVKRGNPQYVKKIVRAVIVRQKQPIRRASGMRVKFEDNAAILMTDANLPVGTEVKGPIAREVVERFIKVAEVASMVV